VFFLKTQNSKLKTQNSKLKTQNSKLKTQNSKLKTQNSKLKTQNSKLKTQNMNLETFNGAGDGAQTGDLPLGKATLYQLIYLETSRLLIKPLMLHF
ncbi:MAG: hypothetical protein ACXVCL_18870, partial [Bdellovibrio sp.]